MKKRRRFSNYLYTIIFLLLFIILGIQLTESPHAIFSAHSGFSNNPAWYLILVNKEHPIPQNYSVDLITLSNGEKVDARIYPELQQMFDDARANGLGLFVASGYRNSNQQRMLFEERVNAYLAQGLSKKSARATALLWVAAPGTSEHELGIAVDINADPTISTGTSVYTWLAENSYKYGFICRYPQDKSDLTGVHYEPWHYRYVGKEAAEEIFKNGLCLEEYLETLGK